MSSLKNSLEILFNKMEGFISSKTVVGEPINIGNVIIVPLVDISVGVGAGAGLKDLKDSKDLKGESSGGGLGAKITPSAMLVIQDGSVQLVDVKTQSSVNKLIDMVPGIINKFDFSSWFKKDSENESNEEETE